MCGQMRLDLSGARHEPVDPQWRERLMNAQRTQYLIPSDDYRTYTDR